MSFDMGIWDTVFMVVSLTGAVLAYFFVKPKHRDDGNADK